MTEDEQTYRRYVMQRYRQTHPNKWLRVAMALIGLYALGTLLSAMAAITQKN